jgi:type IV pilus assembly protein PilY1
MSNTMKNPSAAIHAVASALAALAFVLSPPACAEDIDIYSGATGAGALPNVLIVLDNSANWSSSIGGAPCYYTENGVVQIGDGPKATSPGQEQGTKMAIEKCALYNLIDALPTNADGTAMYNVGLMLFNESPAADSGGYPRVAIKPLDTSTKAAFKTAIRNLTIGGDKGNNAAFSKSLYEAYLYLRNAAPYVGTRGTKWDHDAVVGGRYVTPSPNSCGRNYVIFIANGSPGEVTNNDAKALLAAAGGNVNAISYPSSYITSSDQANWADEFTRFMSGTDVSSRDGTQSIIVHTIAVTGASSDGRYPTFIDAMADHGHGNFKSASDATALTLALQDLFNSIQAASSVFAAASLPISVTSRGTYTNHVFMGMFVPDGESRPRWMGNLKQFEFAYDQVTRTLKLVDSEGNPAINEGTGFIAPGVVSHWTHSSSFWLNSPAGTPPSASDSPDGEVVYKGAAAQVLRDSIMTDQSGRKVFTCVSCASDTSLASATGAQFTSSNNAITSAALGVSDAERANLIDWVRGSDNAGDESGPGSGMTVRPSVHGDVLHSRPAVVNYGGSIGIVVYYGANDGMLHAVVGNKDGAEAGETLWSFVPQEQFSKLNRLRANAPLVKFPSTLAATATPRDYYVDGPISVYQRLDSAGNTVEVKLFVTMRRGGRALYAFDVSDPARPRYLWRKTSTDIAILGQTWSEPKVARIRRQTRPVIIMGGGYDPIEDLTSPGTPTMGNAVLVLDADSGDVLHTFTDIDRPVPADVTLVDSDYDGKVDRAYAVDLGGSIYRLDFERTDAQTGTTRDVWEINKLAALGASGGRKFFYPPDVVLTKGFAVLFAGSGDREKPLATNTQDYFYTVIDRNLGKGIDSETFRAIAWGDGTLVEPRGFNSPATQNGCYAALAIGEKVVNAPITIAGRTYFSTNQPQTSPNSCSANLGLAKSYAAPLICRMPIGTELVGGGLPPSPVAGVVEVPYTDPGTGEEGVRHVPFIIGGDAYSVDHDGDGINDNSSTRCNQALGPCEPNPTVAPKRTKIFWHTETER